MREQGKQEVSSPIQLLNELSDLKKEITGDVKTAKQQESFLAIKQKFDAASNAARAAGNKNLLDTLIKNISPLVGEMEKIPAQRSRASAERSASPPMQKTRSESASESPPSSPTLPAKSWSKVVNVVTQVIPKPLHPAQAKEKSPTGTPRMGR